MTGPQAGDGGEQTPERVDAGDEQNTPTTPDAAVDVPDEKPADSDSEVRGLPCDVKALLVARCQSCHASPPLAAPMALVSYDDLMAPAKSDADVRVVDMVIVRMKRGDMPPGAPGPAVEEAALIEAWVERGAEAEVCDETPEEEEEPLEPPPEPEPADPEPEDPPPTGEDPEPEVLGLPCDVDSLLAARCRGCHSSPPLGAPMALVSYDDLLAPAVSNSSMRVLDVVIARMQRGDMPPFPPAPTAGEIAVMESWAERGAEPEACGSGEPEPDPDPPQGEPDDDDEDDEGDDDEDDGDDEDGEPSDDPFDADPVCSSGEYYTDDSANPSLMHPGTACLGCHTGSGSAPAFTIAGTVYATAHEPDECRGVDRTAHATVIITGSDGAELSLPVNGSGNFYTTEAVAMPFRARLRADDRERQMGSAQMTGNCNGCHTQSGANGAPGRIVLP